MQLIKKTMLLLSFTLGTAMPLMYANGKGHGNGKGKGEQSEHHAQPSPNRAQELRGNRSNKQHENSGAVERHEGRKQGERNFAERPDDRHERREGKHHERRGDHDGDGSFGLGIFGGTPYPYAPPYGYSEPYNQSPYYSGPTDPYDMGYNDGFAAGQSDRINGYPYNPRQVERSGSPDYFEGFVAGYRAGWTS
jgi:hypothetical protein